MVIVPASPLDWLWPLEVWPPLLEILARRRASLAVVAAGLLAALAGRLLRSQIARLLALLLAELTLLALLAGRLLLAGFAFRLSKLLFVPFFSHGAYSFMAPACSDALNKSDGETVPRPERTLRRTAGRNENRPPVERRAACFASRNAEDV